MHLTLYKWTLWYKNNKKSWKDSLEYVYIIDSVETFWSLFFNIKTPSQIDNDTGYLFFKGLDKPDIESNTFKDGGKWIFMVNLNESVDYFWLNMLMCLIAQDNNDFDIVKGIYVYKSINKISIQVWLSNIVEQNKINNVAKKLIKYSKFKNKIYFLPLDKQKKITYQTVGKMKCLYYNN